MLPFILAAALGWQTPCNVEPEYRHLLHAAEIEYARQLEDVLYMAEQGDDKDDVKYAALLAEWRSGGMDDDGWPSPEPAPTRPEWPVNTMGTVLWTAPDYAARFVEHKALLDAWTSPSFDADDVFLIYGRRVSDSRFLRSARDMCCEHRAPIPSWAFFSRVGNATLKPS
jgi:hypothetical protein